MKLIKHILITAAVVLTTLSCRSTNTTSPILDHDIDNNTQDTLFIGCVPSVGECRYSCPERNGRGQPDKSLCFDDIAPIACGCPTTSFVPPTPPDETLYDFVGCVPSGSECRYSCNSRSIIAFQGSDQCEMRQFACYCKK